MIAALVHYVSLAVFAFGAMAFAWLAWSYWRERRDGSAVFRLFTLVCAAAFALNLSAALLFITHPVFDYLRDLLVGALPPLMLHLALERERIGRSAMWQAVLAVLYFSALIPEDDWLPTLRLAISAALGVGMLLLHERARAVSESRHRRWNQAIFAGLLTAALGSRYGESPIYDLAPDYLLLTFLGVWLYYSERLAFFDVFLKGGIYFATGAAFIGIVQVAAPAGSVFVLFTLWLAGPLAKHWLHELIDRRALRRRYSAIDAERIFAAAIQSCASQAELREKAQRTLRDIFGAEADVWPDRVHPAEGELQVSGIRLHQRANQIPYLSGDRALLETLARTLEVVRENVAFRAQQQELRDHAARAEVRALRAQINPHFLFNALNAIAGWIRTRPELADETVTQLAEVFRYALNRSQQEWVRLGEELDFLGSYLAVEQARFGDRLTVHILAGPALAAEQVPTMLIQPIVENAMKHGLSQVAAGAHLTIAAQRAGETLTIDVIDNGPGFPPSFTPANGHGLRNIADRLLGYYQHRASLQWDNTPEGCRVRLTLPLARNL
jgi:signal transduction histidine kinase